MVTRISPARAAANCVRVHSAQLGDQMPMRSPGASPSASSPAASLSARAASSRYVQRMDWGGEMRAISSGHREAARSRAAPMVYSRSGGVSAPRTWLGVAGMGGLLREAAMWPAEGWGRQGGGKFDARFHRKGIEGVLQADEFVL